MLGLANAYRRQGFHTEQLIAKSLQDAACSHVQLRDNGCMKERTSKQLLFVESIIFLVPVSLLTGLYALFLIPMYASGGLLNEPLGAHAVPLFTIVGLILQLCGWRIPNYLAVPALVPFIHLMIERWHSGTE